MAETGKRKRRARRTTKDRVLQARIPENLDEELRDRAEQLGLSVSTVVRNVLLHTFDLVEGVVSDSAQVARVLDGRRPRSAASSRSTGHEGDTDSVVGWQEVTLNLNGVCDNCNAILAKGQRAAIGIPMQSRPVLLCSQCLGRMGASTEQALDHPEQEAGSPAGPARRREKAGK